MTIGIYRLNFSSSAFYIGQSVNIESRYANHRSELSRNKSNVKMLEEYAKSGTPTYEILEDCGIEDLDEIELYYINKLNATVYPGLNVLDKPGPMCKGSYHSRALYDKDVYVSIMFKLIENKKHTYKSVASELNVPEHMVRDISSGSTHTWLCKEYPKEYALMKTIRKGKALSNVKDINPKVVSPEGIEYDISGESISAFARQHKINANKLAAMMRGDRQQSQGWRLSPII